MRLIGRPSQHNQGVGSIIGAVFIALILLSGFAFYAVTLDTTQHYNNTISSMSAMDWNRNQEHVVIKQIATTNTNQLNVTAENDGPIQSHLIWLGIFNTTATPQNQTYQALNEFVRQGETDDIVSNSTVIGGNKYVIQLVTELGNTVESKFYPASNVSCALTLVTAPPTVYQGNNVTVLLTVTPNDTAVHSIQSLTATLNATPSSLVQLVGNSSLSVSGLTRGTSAFFWWIYNAANTGSVTFNATFMQAPAGTYALSTAQIVNPPQQGGQGSVTVAGVNCTASQNPSQWNLLGSTQNISGSIPDLASNDSGYAIFNSYNSGTSTNINHFVDNNSSNVDNSTNIGTHSNFTAQQYTDSIYDTLTEADTDPLSDTPETYVYCNSGVAGANWTNRDNARDNNTGSAATFSSNTGTGFSVGYLTLNLSTTAIGSKINFWVTRTSDSVTTMEIDIANATGSWLNVYSATPTYEAAYVNVSITFSQYTAMRFRFYRTDTSSKPNICEVRGFSDTVVRTNYQLDIEERFASVDTGYYSNKELCIFAGTWSTSETIKVDVWNTTSNSWVNVKASLTKSAWNNVSIADLLTATVTIRFTDGTPSSDTVQDSWSIDATLLHLWTTTTDQYTAEVEFAGSSNLQDWTRLVWQIQSCWDIGQVTVTIQLYNFTLGAYASNGNGYLSYVSSATPNTDELMSQTITLSPIDFKNSTGHWRVKIKGVKSTSTQFLMKVDWIDFTTTYSTSGSIISYNAWQWYTIKATTANGDPIPYAYVSIYANGTSAAFRNVTDKTSIANPAWVRLDAAGTFQLEVKSANRSVEVFVLYAVVGSVVGQEVILQEAP